MDLTPRSLRSVSFIIPMYNEEETLPLLRRELEAWLPSLGDREYEILLINDGSKDGTLAFLTQWAAEDSRIKIINFSRNFGHQAAVTAGMRHASGEAVVIMDADMQDPLAIIHEMIARYEEGYDVAYGQRMERLEESVFKRATAWAFYRLMRRCVHKELPVDAGDFRLVSRQCLDTLNAMPETHRFLRGLFAWAGFAQIAVPYVRPARQFGETKYPLRKMAALAWSAISSFSTFPIRIITVVGFVTGLGGLGVACYALVRYLMGATVPGWTTLICMLALLGGMILVALGIIGEYVGKIYEEVKQRPLYIVQHTINLK